MMSNSSRTLYVGVPNDLERRLWEHRAKLHDGFTRRYNVTMLVFSESYASPCDAIAREKQVKGWSRAKQIDLIEPLNPQWLDLSTEWDII